MTNPARCTCLLLGLQPELGIEDWETRVSEVSRNEASPAVSVRAGLDNYLEANDLGESWAFPNTTAPLHDLHHVSIRGEP